jgi:hypothetical protein
VAKDKLLTKGESADSLMRGVNLADWGVQGALGYARLAAKLQSGMKKGARAAASQLANTSQSYGIRSAGLGLAIEAGNTAWLAADPDKRARVEAEYETNSKKPAIERAVEGALNASDTLYATGKAAYDTGKTYESIERSRMDEINNSLLRKIAKHDKQTAKAAQDSLGINPEFEKAVKATPVVRSYREPLSPPGDLLRDTRERAFPTKHPLGQNADGSRSNVVIMGHSESKDGPVYAIPTMVGGKQLAPKEALAVAKSNGLQNYHKDMTPEEHNAWAKANHGNIDENGYVKHKAGRSLVAEAMRRSR